MYDNSLSSFISDVPSLTQGGWDYINQKTREKFYPFGEWVKQKGQWVIKILDDNKEIVDNIILGVRAFWE